MMRHYRELSTANKLEADLLCKYAGMVEKGYKEEMSGYELWEETYKLRQIVKKKLLEIMNRE